MLPLPRASAAAPPDRLHAAFQLQQASATTSTWWAASRQWRRRGRADEGGSSPHRNGGVEGGARGKVRATSAQQEAQGEATAVRPQQRHQRHQKLALIWSRDADISLLSCTQSYAVLLSYFVLSRYIEIIRGNSLRVTE